MSSKDEIHDGKKKRLLKGDIPPGLNEPKKHKADFLYKPENLTPGSEEDEALQADPLVDLQSFQASCDFLKSAIKEIKELKKKPADTSTDISSIRTDATIHFIHMKKLNRLAHFRCRKVREITNEAKYKIDQCHLQLQNLLYEAMHLEKEITKCMEFKSKDEEIELVPLEEFYKSAPATVSKPDLTRKDVHQQMLSRLEWELEQRKQLAIKLGETKSEKEKVAQEIQSRQDYLDTLQPKLAAILQATRPVQDYLDMPYDSIKEEHQKAQHLPVPLYVLYMQTSAYKEACDKNLKVSIVGDVDAAKSLVTFTFEPDEDSDSDQDEQEKADSKRRKKSTEVKNLETKNRILKKHPLSVVLDITSKDGADLQLTFWYLLALNIITVSVKVIQDASVTLTSISGGDLLSPDLILDELYPNDHGSDSPNVANHFELKKHGLQELSGYIPAIGRPYLWCQWMGGLQFLKRDLNKEDGTGRDEENGLAASRVVAMRAKHSISAANMQKTITLLRERMRARVSLLQLLSSLERGIIPLAADSLNMFPVKINSQLTSWKRSTFPDIQVLPHAERFIKAGVIRESDLIFTAVMERGSARMTVYVVLTADCPRVPPLFVVDIMWQALRTALTDIHIMEMEEEVNLHFKELLQGKSHDQLLANQLQRLLMCFDVYLETDTPASSLVPVEIPKEKMMPRTCRGPARSKPYKYVPELGIFTHRC